MRCQNRTSDTCNSVENLRALSGDEQPSSLALVFAKTDACTPALSQASRYYFATFKSLVCPGMDSFETRRIFNGFKFGHTT